MDIDNIDQVADVRILFAVITLTQNVCRTCVGNSFGFDTRTSCRALVLFVALPTLHGTAPLREPHAHPHSTSYIQPVIGVAYCERRFFLD